MLNYVYSLVKLSVCAGNIRRFRRICEHIQSQVCSKRFPGPSSPPTVTSVTQAVSESSSCGSVSSERLSYKRQVVSSLLYSNSQDRETNWVIFRLKTIWRTIPYSRTSRAMDVGPRPQTTIMPIQLTFPEVPLQCDPSKQLALWEQTVILYSSKNIFILFS